MAMHKYRLKYRPCSFCTLPRGLEWRYIEAPRDIAHMRPDLPVSSWPYGVFATDRALTPDEMRAFEIESVA